MITFMSGRTEYQTLDNGATFRRRFGIKYVQITSEVSHAKAAEAFAAYKESERIAQGISVESVTVDTESRDAHIAAYFARQA